MLLWLLVACGPHDGVVKVKTRDGVTLVADLWVASPGRPGVVLLHATPTAHFDRHDWPQSFVDLLRAHDWNVIAVDRRGGGESEGDPHEAYEGEKGRYDVEACVVELERNDLTDLVVIGASNGTTTMVDYAAWAGGEGLPVPVALGFMTGGDYTTANTPLSDLPDVPAVLTYSTAERAWSVGLQETAPVSWEFLEYADGAHGTRMFTAAPEVADDLDAFFGAVVP